MAAVATREPHAGSAQAPRSPQFILLALILPRFAASQDTQISGLEFGAGVHYFALDGNQWGLDGGPGFDLILGYRWSSEATVRGVVGMSWAGEEQLVFPDVVQPGPAVGSSRHLIVPHATAEVHFQPRSRRGIVDRSVGIRLGFTGRHPGAFGFGARGGARFRRTAVVPLEAGLLGDVMYLSRRASATPWTTRGGIYVMVVGQ